MSVSLLPKTSERASIATYKPSREEQRYIDDGMAFLSMTAPFFAHILYAQMNVAFTKAVPWAATDGHTIFVNPEGCEAEGWGIEEVAFVLAHEIMHYVFADLLVAPAWREEGKVFTGSVWRPYDAGTMNRAMDFRINAALIEAHIGTFPKIGCYDPAMSAKGMEDCVAIYERMWVTSNQGPGGFDEHLEPSKGDLEREARLGEHRRSQVMAGAMQAAEAAGMSVDDLPSVVRRMVGEILNPKVKWGDHLKATMARSAGEPRSNPRSVNKHMIARPIGGRIVASARSKYGCGIVCVGWDTSGSVIKWQDAFFAEMAGIVAELNPQRLIVIRCDMKVHAVDELDQPSDLTELREAVNAEGIGGGGGTRFAPVFEWLEEHDITPDMTVYLTDMEGSFPQREPDHPVIWASIKPAKKAPFGEIVDVEL